MKRIMALVMTIVMLMSFMTFTTVSAENSNLKAMIKAGNIKVTEANVKMNATIETSGQAFSFMGIPVGQIAAMDYDVNIKANEEMTECEADGRFSVSMPSLISEPFGFEMWIKEDISDVNNAEMYVILRLAEVLRSQMEVEKEYIYIDYTQIPGFEEIIKFVSGIDEAEIEKLAQMIMDVLKEYVGEDVIAEVEQRLYSLINEINVEYANGRYTLVMGDAQVKRMYATLFDILFDALRDVAVNNGIEIAEYDATIEELYAIASKLSDVQIFDRDRALVIGIAEDGSNMHVELNLATNFYDLSMAIDPAGTQGVDASMRDMFGIGMSIKADAVVSPLAPGYIVNFPELSDGNTYDVTAEFAPIEEEFYFEPSTVVIEYNGENVSLENMPILRDDRTFVPLRELANLFGISDDDIFYDEATQKVTIKSGDVEIIMQIGSSMTFVNNELKTLDVPAFTYNDRTYIPVRFVSEMFHKNVDYVDLNAAGQGEGIVVMIND